MTPVIYDAGVLIAAERNERRVWADHKVRLEAGIIPYVPAPVIAQVSRTPAQVQLRRLLRGCKVLSLTERTAHGIGHLLGLSRTTDIADAAVAHAAAEWRADVVTSDAAGIRRLLQAAESVSGIITI